MQYDYFLRMIFAFIISAITIPLFGRIAYKTGIVDKPDGNLKPHERVTPYLGGLPIFLAVISTTQFDIISKISLTVLTLTGLYDDVRNLNPKIRLLVEFLVGALLVFKYLGFSLLFPIYVIIIVALINATNMMDGLDGVCASVSLLSALGLAVVSTSKYDTTLLIALVGALLGYLLYNYPPARIFMGDAGSYLIGGTLSIGLLSALREGTNNLPRTISAFIFVSIFFFDLSSGVLRRVLNGRSPFSGDRGHIYDKINGTVNDKRKTLWIMIFIQVFVLLIGLAARINIYLMIASLIVISIMYVILSKWLNILKY
ncbi:MAG: glycosyltransferase family 4 protein [Fervidobacterium sp.]|uniref:glycosyltransferase family 4 protein n=1 Tax=Fervidobacterium sp. TaxID=1871331 RepID=UPI00404B63D7